jgi:hypothetical protein
MLLLFLEYDFTIMYKPCKIHVLANALSGLSTITKPTCVHDQCRCKFVLHKA